MCSGFLKDEQSILFQRIIQLLFGFAGGGGVNFPDSALGLIDLVASSVVGIHDLFDGPLLDGVGMEDAELLGRGRCLGLAER